ncbi:hypothetical protein EPVG_00316 [Emiliania huxleyi virus 201]|nr:hypothetical protein ELVG_00298 [Emiliania huxleyi virus 203]AEP15780.1 hypothetical protein EQVG_00371 [Emiliania huxleyi virus 207]AEP16163.1 hypothetical protein ERVG_00288 [Emiliania huxleyi virus 208]AET42352.1 hypothetical protein EXVG_00468 [Emiliania huxleyi virus 202]AET98203.1 hypothetical protein EPVG_00316 [Emiliania huxleyi virus 201]
MSSDSSLNAILKSFGYDSIEEFDREDAAKLAATGCSSWTEVNKRNDEIALDATGCSSWTDINKRNDEIALDATGCSSWTEVNAAKKCRGARAGSH